MSVSMEMMVTGGCTKFYGLSQFILERGTLSGGLYF